MDRNFGLMLLLFGSFIIYFSTMGILLNEIIIIFPVGFLMFFWAAMPFKQSKTWDKIRRHIFLIGIVWSIKL